MQSLRFISSDSHIFEPPDLWTSRLPSEFQDRSPRIVREDNTDWWMCDGYKMTSAIFGAGAGRRFERPGQFGLEEQFENVRLGGYIPDERIKDMDLDGVDAEVIYPTADFRAMDFVRESDLLQAICSAYNDWLAEFCAHYPDRLMGMAMVCLDNIEWGIGELKRCHKNGLVGAMIPTTPPAEAPYSKPDYDPFWAVAQDLATPIAFHVGTVRPSPTQKIMNVGDAGPPSRCVTDASVRTTLGHMIFGRVFERFPGLTVGSVEFENGWVPHFLEQIDYDYTQRTTRPAWPKFQSPDMLPSDFFRRNVFVSFQEGQIGIILRSRIGVETLTWGSDYPHVESTFPKSREILTGLLADCSEEEKAKIVGGNAARVYGLD